MLHKGKFKWDRNIKPIYKFKNKNFGYNSKKCSSCGKRKNRFHHYLCEKCYQEKQRRNGF